jgi:hypothetical protein
MWWGKLVVLHPCCPRGAGVEVVGGVVSSGPVGAQF